MQHMKTPLGSELDQEIDQGLSRQELPAADYSSIATQNEDKSQDNEVAETCQSERAITNMDI